MRIKHSAHSHYIKRLALGLVIAQLMAAGYPLHAGVSHAASGARPELKTRPRTTASAQQSTAPAIVSVNPNIGGGAIPVDIIITGLNFAAGARVVVGGVEAAQVSVPSSDFIDALIPPHAPGTVDVQVINPDGQSDTFKNGFTFPGAPELAITGVQIDGKNLIVTGQRFDAGTVLMLDATPQKTRPDPASPSTVLIGKKVAKQIAPGQTVTLQVRDSTGALSPEFMFVRSN